jgi:opacity protein-like surface antigen
MKKNFLAVLLLAGVVLMLASSAQAQISIVDLPDVGGQGYFLDQSTGYTWMDVDNFLNMSCNEVLSAIDGTGFRFATSAELLALQLSAPAYADVYSSHAEAIGDALWGGDRLIWGLYDDGDGNDTASWSWKWIGDNGGNWNYNYGGNEADFYLKFEGMGAFVLSTGNTAPVIPEPTTMLLFGTGLVGFAVKRRKV